MDLHEGCGRTKLFWLLALADKATLQALVEFRDAASNPTDLSVPVAQANVQLARVGVCRYCGMVSNDGLLAIGNVCANDECQVRDEDFINLYFANASCCCYDAIRTSTTIKYNERTFRTTRKRIPTYFSSQICILIVREIYHRFTWREILIFAFKFKFRVLICLLKNVCYYLNAQRTKQK